MWNHAPEMWTAMKEHGVAKGSMTQEKAADLFAYFVSARYFERPGDAARGKAAFAAKHCAECHGIASSPVAAAPPVAKWESLADPVVLAQQMWNHGGKMRAEFSKKKLAWSMITAQELTDMLVYLQNLPETRSLATNFAFPPSDTGEKLFEAKGCSGCHVGKRALDVLLKNQTLTDIAVDMWNHQPGIRTAAGVIAGRDAAISYAQISGNGNPSGRRSSPGVGRWLPQRRRSTESAKADAYSDITMNPALGPRSAMLEPMKQKSWRGRVSPRFRCRT